MIKAENFWRDDLDNRPVMVSIRCTVFNHAPYLRECLDGFVKQKTNFRFETIVHDDCSTDESAAIIKEYAEKYPSIIKPIFEEENQWSKRNGTLRKIMNVHLRGKYVAWCEGDDYWTDPFKLQKQIDFLENHSDFTLCFTKANVLADDESLTHLYEDLEQREYSGYEMLRNWIVPTCTIIIRSDLIKEIPYNKRFQVGDIRIILTAAKYGKCYCLDDVTATYRRLSSGWTLKNKGSIKYYQKRLEHNKAMSEYFPEYHEYFESQLPSIAAALTLCYFKKPKALLQAVTNYTKEYGITYHKNILTRITNKIIRTITMGKLGLKNMCKRPILGSRDQTI